MAQFAKKTVALVLDRERSIREGVARLLAQRDLEIITFAHGRQGFELTVQTQIDLALVDLRLENPDGIDIIRDLNSNDPDLPIIALVGQATIEEAVAAIKAGARDILTKPFAPDQLERVVDRALETAALRRERDSLRAERDQGLWAITTQKSRLTAVINSMAEGVMIADPDGSIIMCNPAFTRRMHITKRCILGSDMGEVPELIPINKMATELISNTDQTLALTKEITIKDPTTIHLLVTIDRVVNRAREALGLVTVLRDITPQKELEQKKSDFVAMVTHELRAPLAAAETQLHVILKGLAGDLTEKQEDMLIRMRSRITGALELITNLLDLAKIESQSFVSEKVALKLNPIIEEAITAVTEQADEKNLDLITDLTKPLPLILADQGSLHEVALNLLSNAIRYTPEGGLIKVASGFEAGYVHFSVSDNGIGILKEDLDKIFDRFYRVKSEQTRHVVGTGLGLPIVEAIVRDHLGYVRVASKPGEGTTFRVMLPTMD